jgi:hypothetical protein
VAEAVYILCSITCLACAGLLLRAWRRTPSRLLFWSAVCFIALAVNSLLLIADMMVFPQYDLRIARLVAAACGLVPLLWTLISKPQV